MKDMNSFTILGIDIAWILFTFAFLCSTCLWVGLIIPELKDMKKIKSEYNKGVINKEMYTNLIIECRTEIKNLLKIGLLLTFCLICFFPCLWNSMEFMRS